VSPVVVLRRKILWALFPLGLAFVAAGWNLAQTLLPLSQATIVLDPGHGGIDPGANRPGILEKDINLAVALRLQAILAQRGAHVVLTRDRDVSLEDRSSDPKISGRYHRDLAARIEIAAASGADLFISIHANASSVGGRGAQTFFCPGSETGRALAEAVHTEIVALAGGPALPQPGNFFVLRRMSIPAILVETGYITNSREKELLLSPAYQERLAEAIARGIIRFWRSRPHEQLPDSIEDHGVRSPPDQAGLPPAANPALAAARP